MGGAAWVPGMQWVWGAGRQDRGEAVGARRSAGSIETTLPRTDITSPKRHLSSALICAGVVGVRCAVTPPFILQVLLLCRSVSA